MDGHLFEILYYYSSKKLYRTTIICLIFCCCCYEQNVCVLPKFIYIEALIPKVSVFGSEASGR